MAKILFLGTSASIPTPTRDNTSFLFFCNKETFLVDCPGALIHKLIKSGVDFRKINRVIITHQHPDHIYGLVHLIHANMYMNKEIEIFTSKISMKIIRDLLKSFRLRRKHFPRIVLLDVFAQEYFFKTGKIKVKAVPNKHIKGSFGVRFIWSNKSLLYSSDTAPTKTIIKEAEKSTYLIHDCTASSSFFKKHPDLYRMHTDSLSLSRLATTLSAKKVIPIHFLFLRKNEERLVKEELKIIGSKLLFPSDLQTIHL